MKLIGMSLLVIIVLSLFSVIFGNSFIGNTSLFAFDNNLIVNGTVGTLESEGNQITFGIDIVTGAILILTGIVAFVTVVGINILGSGLSPSTVRTLTICTMYIGVWALFSILAFNLIWSIEVFGFIIYVTLTIAYVVGVVQKISGGD